ncbi:MAG: DUF1700 domain-containing protein [Lachnospiraceae bacterium]|nr:DUF1700 domain-containing protein [Lachnospiraceae bacterium]
MNRYDFMRQLEMLLSDITPNERKEALQFYNDYFDDAGAENEQNVIKALGSPAKVAASIKADLTGNGSAGEFTETGYKDPYSKNQEIMKYGQSEEKTANQENKDQTGNGAGQNGTNQRSTNRNNPYSNNPYSGNPYGNNPYSNNASTYAGNGQNGGSQSGSSQNGTNPGSNYNSTSYNNSSYNNAGGYSGSSGKKEMSGGTLALAIILCVFGIPILLPIAVGLLGVVIAIVAVIVSLFIAVAATALALIVVGVVLFVVGISKLIVAPFGGLYLAGGGLACVGVGILFAVLAIWLCASVVPAIVKAVADQCRKLFKKQKKSTV